MGRFRMIRKFEQSLDHTLPLGGRIKAKGTLGDIDPLNRSLLRESPLRGLPNTA